MLKRLALYATLAAPLVPIAAQARPVTITLDVHHAGCVLCGPIVKRTLAGVRGVRSVLVSQADGAADVKAVVVYDDAQTSPKAMIAATTERGYPAQAESRR